MKCNNQWNMIFFAVVVTYNIDGAQADGSGDPFSGVREALYPDSRLRPSIHIGGNLQKYAYDTNC